MMHGPINIILKLIYIHSALLHDSANHMATFREVQHTEWIHQGLGNEIAAESKPIHKYKVTIIEPYSVKYINTICW